ncbi:MAG: hypothetical protein KKA19_07305 [Candidatus Margulisbacteria bacterium]|nr:hypothetical protein [Candidatus Margulisiibacteriota bacterium]
MFFCAAQVFAEQAPVRLKADDLRYNDETRIIIASGNVQVIYEDFEIKADRLEMDTNDNFVTASGEIVVSKNGVESMGQALFFDLKSKELKLSDFSVDFYTEQVVGAVYMKASELMTSGNMKYGYKGSITTCGLKEPHYWLSAYEFRYYPDEKIEGFHVFYNFSFIPMPVFYTPYYQFQLGKRKMILLLPVIGENKVEGFFVKNEMIYVIDNETDGSIYMDHLSKKGIGRGFKHNYQIDGAPGSFYLYNVNENIAEDEEGEEIGGMITSNYVTKFNQTLNLDDYSTLDFKHKYSKIYLIPSGYKDATDFNLGYKFNDDWRTLELRHKYNLDYTTEVEGLFYSAEHTQEDIYTKITLDKNINPLGKTRSDSLLVTHRQSIVERWSIETTPRFYQVQNFGLYPDQRLDVPVVVTHTGLEDDFYKQLKIEYLTYQDPDGDRVQTDVNTEYINKLPLTTLSLQTLDLDLFKVDTDLGVGVFQESKYFSATNTNRRYTTTRYTSDLTLYRDFDILWGTVLTLKREIRQAAYNTGDKHYRVSDKPALKTNLWNHVEHEFSYIYTKSDGNSPIYYEAPQLDHEHRTLESIRFYHEDVISWKFSGGKNLELNTMDDLITDLNVRPFGKYLATNFNYGWSYQRELWRDFVASLMFLPNREDSWTVNYVYDFNEYEYKSASSVLKFHVGKTWWKEDEWEFWRSRWAFAIEHVYDPFTETIDLYTLGVYKDLHCWMAQFNYNKAREEWILAFSLKAFPDEPVSMTSNKDGFSIEAFRRSLENPGVTRY